MAVSLTMDEKLAEDVLFPSRRFTLDQNVFNHASVASVASVNQPLILKNQSAKNFLAGLAFSG